MTNDDRRPLKVTVVSAGAADASSTKLLADRAAAATVAFAESRGRPAETSSIDLRSFAGEIMAALTTRVLGERLLRAVEDLADADGIIVATPSLQRRPEWAVFLVLPGDRR